MQHGRNKTRTTSRKLARVRQRPLCNSIDHVVL